MSESTVLLEFNGNAAIVTLNRPDKLNSFDAQMHRDLRSALDRCDEASVRALVLTGAGRGFCAGQDLAETEYDLSKAADIGRILEENFNPLVRRIRAMPFPVICAVNGVAAGAGANLALACDIVIAGRSAKFIQAFAKIGLIPDAGGTWSLSRLIGEARAKGLAMLAEPLDAERAANWGLIWQVVDDDVLVETATDMAVRLANEPTLSFALTKRAIHRAGDNDFDNQLDVEKELQVQAAGSHDYREGVAAFLEKRKAEFKGR